MIAAHYRSRRRRANVLMICIAIMIILAVLVTALHHYEVVTRRALSKDEADIQLAIARKWETGRALEKIPASLRMPSDILVSTSPQAVQNDLYVSDEMGADLFSRDEKGAWNGFPNLVVQRIYRIDPAAETPGAPPNFKEYRGTPTSLNPSYDIYNGRVYRTMTGDFLPVAALAPRGNIRLEGCSAFPNPNREDVGVAPPERYSGLPANLAAGGNVTVSELRYGNIYAGKAVQASNCTLATSRVGPLPYPDTIGSTLQSQIDEARNQLVTVASTLDNKTQQISGEPPTIRNLMELIFTDALRGNGTAITNKLLGWVSLRSALEFPFITLPGFSSVTLPGTYYSCQIWFHGPFAPDTEGRTATGGQTPSQLGNDLARRLGQLQTARAINNYMLAQIEGGNSLQDLGLDGPLGRIGDKVYEPEGGYDSEGNPIGAYKPVDTVDGDEKPAPPQVNPGLKARGQTIQAAMLADLTVLEQARASGVESAVTTGLKTNQSMLAWMGDYQGYLLDDAGRVPQNGVASNLGLGVDSFTYDLKASGTSSELYRNDVVYPMINKGLLGPSKAVFTRLKDHRGKEVVSGGLPVRDPSKAPSPQFQGQKVESNQPLSQQQWNTILEAPERSAPLNPLERQIELFRFFTGGDADNPFKKVVELEQRLLRQIALIDKKKAEINLTISAEQEVRRIANSKLSGLPQTRHAEETEAKYRSGVYSRFQDNRGISGRAYLRYGFSFDMLWKAIAYLADRGGSSNAFWNTYVPLVWWGTSKNVYPIQTVGALDITATFTVPQGRTFYYENPMTVRGDLWLQRGSTLVVNRGNLEVSYPDTPMALASTYVQAVNVLPGGKIFMEEGSNLIVANGNLYCHGPVVVTGQPGFVRPISTSIMVPHGDTVLRQGVIPGMGLTDICQASDMQPVGHGLNKYTLYPLMSTIMPNLGKLPYTGPFHTRKCYFASSCTQYICTIIVGPFGIPIPVIAPWPFPRENRNVQIYQIFSFIYTGMCNLSLGENLYPASDYWPFGHRNNNGRVPILPKINLRSFLLDTGITGLFNNAKRLASLPASEVFGPLLKKLDPTNPDGYFQVAVTNMFIRLIQSSLTNMLPSPFNELASLIPINLPTRAGEKEAGDSNSINDKLAPSWGGLQERLESIPNSTPFAAFKNSLMHEVTGVLVSGRRIFVGYAPPSALSHGVLSPLPPAQRAFLASGLFLATGDVNINSDYTIGAIISTGGSINPHQNCNTNLLYYPEFTRACLYQPGLTPAATRNLNKAMPQFMARALDVTYGVFQASDSGQKGLDVHFPSRQVTAAGWLQQ